MLALALDLKLGGLLPTTVSDDYATQNVSETLGVDSSLANRQEVRLNLLLSSLLQKV